MSRRRQFDYAAVRSAYERLGSPSEVSRELNVPLGSVRRIISKETDAPRRTKSRFASKPLNGARADMPAFDHPALMEGRTIYPDMVRDGRDRWVLKSGRSTAKIGGEVLKGKWKGFPIYTLTLEERATCPRSCRHWRSCYGGKMPLSERSQAGADLEWRLEREIAALELKHLGGFAVRLHQLGDFYSVEYVDFWRRMLDKHAALHVWGYTARFDGRNDPIATALILLITERWDRFAARFSNGPVEMRATVSIEHPYQKPPDAVICPEQVGKTEICSTCALCWQTTRRIAFIQH